MSRPERVPSYRFHKATGKAVVVIKGRSYYLGPWNSPESRAEYRRIIAEWLARGHDSPPPAAVRSPGPGGDIRISELILAYFRYAESYYVKDGEPTKESGVIRLALKPVLELYGHVPAREFGPLALNAALSTEL